MAISTVNLEIETKIGDMSYKISENRIFVWNGYAHAVSASFKEWEKLVAEMPALIEQYKEQVKLLSKKK